MHLNRISALALALAIATLSTRASAVFIERFDTDASDSVPASLASGYPGYVYGEYVTAANTATPQPAAILSISGGEATLDHNGAGSAHQEFYKTESVASGRFRVSVDARGDDANGSAGGGLRIGNALILFTPGDVFFLIRDANAPINDFAPAQANMFDPGTAYLHIDVWGAPDVVPGQTDLTINLTQARNSRTYLFTSTAAQLNPASFAVGIVRQGNSPFGMTFDNLEMVPEPAGLALVGVAGLALLRRRPCRGTGL